jgi:glucose/arabinose dehydrogenase
MRKQLLVIQLASLWQLAKHRMAVAFLFFLIGGLVSERAAAQTLPAGFSTTLVVNGIRNPTALAFAPDGRIFVCQQTGELRVVKNGALLPTPFLTVGVNSSGERGLVGVTLDPDFSVNRYVYVYYTLASGANNRISRFTADGDVAVPGSERVVLDLDPLSSATNHNGGAMHFGLDGKLYVAVGENANGANAQNLDTYHGKLLRINADGSVPAGNPYVGASLSAQRQRVWSYGLRNPFTFAVQPGTGRIFVNDVGGGSWEEINDASSSSLNYGWPNNEGAAVRPGQTPPLYAYPHNNPDGYVCAITGGTFFNPTSTNYPAAYAGKYFYQDLCGRWINYIDPTSGTPVRTQFATNLSGDLVGLETGADGNLYYLSRGAAALYRIVYSAGNTAPVITTQPTSATVSPGVSATFSVGATGTAPFSYQWQKNGANIGGATASSYTIANVAAADAGQYRAVVTNAVGSATSNTATLAVTAVNNPPTARILTPASGATYVGGTEIQFSADATDPEDGPLPASAFVWQVNFYHDTHVHDGTPFNQGVKTGIFAIPNAGELADNVFYRLILTVTDAGGRTTTTFRDILPQKSTISLATSPAGLPLTLESAPQATPASVVSVEGMLRTLGAPSPQTVNGVTYEFVSWSNGGAQTQTIATPTDDATYTATYRVVPPNGTLRTPENPANAVAGLDYAYYQGLWTALPDFPALTPASTGTVT